MRLEKIDLSKGDRKNHPDFKVGEKYRYLLVLTDGQHFAGWFTRQWYGYNFQWDCADSVGLQYDPPGTNYSPWKELYRIHRGPKKEKI